MGIVNVTPDSFADGGRFFSASGPGAAVEHSLRLVAEGADLLDLGAESTRPGATAISAGEEQARLLPVIEALRRERPELPLSVDTYHAATASAVLRTGVEIINDVSGLTWDPEMTTALASQKPSPGLVLMHTRGRPQEWASLPPLSSASVPALVLAGLKEQVGFALQSGITIDHVVLDPGFGFGKLGSAENFALLRALPELHALGRPLMVGLSRKGFLRTSAGRATTAQSDERLHATLAAGTAAILAGAHILRVHDVAAAREAAAVADALLAAQ